MNSAITPTISLTEQQVELEREAISCGLKRLQDQTMSLEDKSYASATIYAISSIEALLPKLVERIEDTNHKIHERNYGKSFREIDHYLKDVEPLAAAAIACKITFDKVFGYKDDCNQAVKVCESIGKGLEDECHMRHYELHAPGLLNTLKQNYWHTACGTHQKIKLVTTLMNRCEVKEWKAWGVDIRVKLGGWLLDCIMETSNWFEKVSLAEGRKTTLYVLPTAAFMDIKDEVMSTAELFSPMSWVMLVPPRDWTNENRGGYILNEVMEGHSLVRHGKWTPIQGERQLPLEFLNKIQKVAYKLNPFTIMVAETLQEKGRRVGKFLPIMEHPDPPKPVDIEDNYDARKVYRREAAQVYNRRAAEFRRSCRTRQTMDAVKRFKHRDRFYIPWSFDYRGRAYPIPAFLTPQDTDFGKSLLISADETYITARGEEWLAFQVATTFGLDKETMANRLLWTTQNTPLITRVATDPIRNIGDWEAADEPWQFLAACEEYYSVVTKRTRKHTRLFVATDATCSGLQILAGLARDRKTAQLVNVLPSERPQDAYKVVAESAKPNCPVHIQKVMDRKTVKRTVMTIPYNAKPFSNRSYIRDALKEKGVEINKEDLTITVAAVREAMADVVPGCLKVMKWIETEVVKTFKRGQSELKWVTPSGFVVTQRIMKRKTERFSLQLLGSCKLSAKTVELDKDGKPIVDLARHKAATAPNLIHSLDASLLHISVEKFHHPIALIHDSVLTRAVDMDELSAIIRETYMHLFAEHDYLTEFAAQIGAETKPPIIGDLQPESVIDSTYFFC